MPVMVLQAPPFLKVRVKLRLSGNSFSQKSPKLLVVSVKVSPVASSVSVAVAPMMTSWATGS